MKNLVYLIVLFLPTVAIYAQQKQRISTLDAQELANDPEEVSIDCSGTCGCSLQGQMGGTNSYVACSCADCVMNITITTKTQSNNEITYSTKEYELINGKVEVPFIKEYFDFASPKSKLQSIRINNDENGNTVVFSYIKDNGESDTIIFTKSLQSRKKYQIECNGDCGCNVIYSFTTNTASCGCADCVMVVNEIK